MHTKGTNDIKSYKKIVDMYFSAILPISLTGLIFSSDVYSVKKFTTMSKKNKNSTNTSNFINTQSVGCP